MSKTSRNLRAFSWGKFSWTEMICVKKLTLCNSESMPVHDVLGKGPEDDGQALTCVTGACFKKKLQYVT